MKSDKSKEMKTFKIMSKHKKYIIMIAIGLALTLSLIITIWLPEDHWGTVVLNIFAMIGSGVLCSAIVSWIIERNNDKVLDIAHQRQREFFFHSLQVDIDRLIVFELRNLSEYVLLTEEGIKKSERNEWSRKIIIKKLQNYVDQITNSIETLYQSPRVFDDTYFEQVNQRNKLAFNTLVYYRYLDSTLKLLLGESNLYFINGVLTEEQAKDYIEQYKAEVADEKEKIVAWWSDYTEKEIKHRMDEQFTFLESKKSYEMNQLYAEFEEKLKTQEYDLKKWQTELLRQQKEKLTADFEWKFEEQKQYYIKT